MNQIIPDDTHLLRDEGVVLRGLEGPMPLLRGALQCGLKITVDDIRKLALHAEVSLTSTKKADMIAEICKHAATDLGEEAMTKLIEAASNRKTKDDLLEEVKHEF